MEILKELAAYVPKNEQEEKDRALIMDYIARNDDAFFSHEPHRPRHGIRMGDQSVA